MESTIVLYHKYIDKFMPSLEMRQYLKSIEIKPWYVPEIIYFSIHPLSEKLEAMKDLNEYAQKVNDQILLKETKFYIRNMEDALKMLDVEGVFVLHEMYYDEDKMESDGGFETLCSSYGDVIEYWEKHFKPDDDSQSENLEWNVVEKWVKDENGKMNLISSYILINGVMVYSQLKFRRFYNDDCGDLYEMQYGEINNKLKLHSEYKPTGYRETGQRLQGRQSIRDFAARPSQWQT